MKGFAITVLVIFFIVKLVIYTMELLSKRGYVTDYGRVLSFVLPIMSVFTYSASLYFINKDNLGFVVNIALAWILLLVSIIVVKHLRIAFCYITANDNYDCYKVAMGVINYTNKIDRDIIFDDNIGIGNNIKIAFNRKKFSREEMALLISEQYATSGAEKKLRRISLLSFMVHMVELIFDTSFIINISMA